MRKSVPVLLFLIFFNHAINGQDPHFSQYFSSPLTLNPAMTGDFTGEHRLSSNYRQQWQAMGEPFVTGTLSYDTKLMTRTLPENDVFGVGLLALYDQSLQGGFKNVNLSVSLAYRKALDVDGMHNIAVGFQGTYASRSINFGELNFANQFNGFGFNSALPSNESFGNSRRNYVDINAGLQYVFNQENVEAYIGGSLYHINKPNTSFLKNEKFSLPMRYTVHGGAKVKIGYNHELFLSGLYMQQAGVSEKNFGMVFGLGVSETTKLYAGSWYRIQDAVIPYLGLGLKNFQMGFSYDITTSSMKTHLRNNNSFEFSLNLQISRPENVYTNYKGRF